MPGRRRNDDTDNTSPSRPSNLSCSGQLPRRNCKTQGSSLFFITPHHLTNVTVAAVIFSNTCIHNRRPHRTCLPVDVSLPSISAVRINLSAFISAHNRTYTSYYVALVVINAPARTTDIGECLFPPFQSRSAAARVELHLHFTALEDLEVGHAPAIPGICRPSVYSTKVPAIRSHLLKVCRRPRFITPLFRHYSTCLYWPPSFVLTYNRNHWLLLLQNCLRNHPTCVFTCIGLSHALAGAHAHTMQRRNLERDRGVFGEAGVIFFWLQGIVRSLEDLDMTFGCDAVLSPSFQ
ncbi:hypothetical protein C8Q74DRAFT_607943 [Fomes fomentarius]|nr:hypothetical protein C8Q74DRAFT_607943 [Fomes fomentarius]